jgi:hypothetical protein
MSPYEQLLRHRFLVAMGLGSLGLTLLPACKPKDVDGDGFVVDQDCDDSNAAIHANAEEICDGIDNNCDGVIDTDATDRSSWYADTDADGYGDPLTSSLTCKAPEGTVADNTDCAPDQAEIHPGAEEQVQDRLDNDCDGMVDEMTCSEAKVPASVEEVQATRGKTPLMFCIDAPEDGQPCTEPGDIQAQTLVNNVIGKPPSGTLPGGGYYSGSWHVGDAVCGPDATVSDSCCYVFRVDEMVTQTLPRLMRGGKGLDGGDEVLIGGGGDQKPTHGRPLTVHGVPRTAPAASSTDWSGAIELDPIQLTNDQRNQVAQAWQQAALYEHASVASFARFTLELMALEAPPELLLAATRAQADEIAHARACFSVASSFAGSPLGPGNLDLTGAMDTAVTPRGVMVQTILEGCINETLAAAEAAWLSEQTEIGEIRRVQKQIAEDESRHAALGWKTVRWLLQKHPELVNPARGAFAQALETATAEEPLATDDAWMTPYGCMPTAERAALQADVWKRVIVPCAQALLDASQPENAFAHPGAGAGLFT